MTGGLGALPRPARRSGTGRGTTRSVTPSTNHTDLPPAKCRVPHSCGERIEQEDPAAVFAGGVRVNVPDRQSGAVVDHLDASETGTDVDVQLDLRAGVHDGVRDELAHEQQRVVEHAPRDRPPSAPPAPSARAAAGERSWAGSVVTAAVTG